MSSAPRVPDGFNGDFDHLPCGSLQELGNFVRLRVLLCKRSRMLFVCSVPETLVGGSRDRNGSLVREILCAEMEQAVTVPKGFWWYGVQDIG